MAFPNDFTYNFCPNPQAVLGTTGAAALNGATITQMKRLGWNSQTSFQVQTPGNATGEGISLPPGTSLGTVTGAVSFQIQGGPANLNVIAIDTTTSTVLGTTSAVLDGMSPWQLVSITGLSLVNGDNISVYVETAVPVVSTFWIGAIQYEPSTTANAGALPTPYIDGNQPQGFWTGTANASASYKPFEFMLTGTGLIHAPGTSQFLSSGQVFRLVNLDPALGPTVVTGGVDVSGDPYPGIETNTPGIPGGVPFLVEGFGTVSLTAFTTISLPSGLTDFAVFKTTDIDPAIIKIEGNNAGAAMGNTSLPGWNRIYGQYTVPKHQQSNAGPYIWNDGVYMAMGDQFGSIVAGSAVNVGYAQVEVASAASPGPSAYQRPRSLVPVMGPTTFNYCSNPSMQNNTTSWTGINCSGPSVATTVSRSTVVYPAGAIASLDLSGTTANIGAWLTATNLVAGQTYTISGEVWPTAAINTTGQLHDIQVFVSPRIDQSYSDNIIYDGGSSTLIPLTMVSGGTSAIAGTEILDGGMSSSSYLAAAFIGSSLTGQVPEGTPMTSWNGSSRVWYRPFVTFKATEANMTMGFWGIPVEGFSGTLEFNVSQVMINLGDNPVPYGDGNSDGWGWEQGATAGNGRSYYYDRVVIASQYVEDILTQHVPLGQYAYQPEYFLPVSQYTS
jgi:hypothetical protein